ncbi:MAG TPA: transcription repressor NadR [Tissierellales bacterium]|nr:transcription repressor NadR [Tissierellales bacterium]
MDSKERRKEILRLLKEKDNPIKGIDLANKLGVSRQIIVQDIAILRAKGERILATPQGYIIPMEKENKLVKTIVCKHTKNEEIEDELKIIVDMGGKVLDVVVEHPLYGEIKSPLMISSRLDVFQFMKNLERTKAEPLSTLTEGIHIHSIEVENEKILENIKEALKKKNYLIDLE